MYEAKYLGSLKAFTGARDVLEAPREGGRHDCARYGTDPATELKLTTAVDADKCCEPEITPT